ncbi:MAG: rRNA maturation RNase YbeY [Thermodesulfobacteriota bacterium]
MPLNIYDSNFYTKSVNKSILYKTIFSTMKYLKLQNKQIDITFISDYMMKKLNLKYLNKEKSTDVLSFSNEGQDPVLLGEIFISLNFAKRNCKENGNSLIKEVKILLIHGVLHLAGYNHKKKIDENIMFHLQEKIYEKFK